MMKATSNQHLVNQVSNGNIEIVASETGVGPTPHELIEAALATCKLMTLQLYAERKGYDITGTEITVSILKEGLASELEAKIKFPDHLPTDVKKRMIEISDKCPINKLLSGEVRIETSEI